MLNYSNDAFFMLASRSQNRFGVFWWLLGLILSTLVPTHADAGQSVFESNSTNVSIPDNGGWVSSTIDISGVPSGALVIGIDVHFSAIHPYSGDLNIDLNADAQGNLGNVDLWSREGGSSDDPSRTVNGITTFNGLTVDRTWYLYARDEASGDSGYIDEWWIRIYYEVEAPPPTLVAPGSASQPGLEISTTTPTMQWSSVSGATGYGFYISRNDGGSWTLIFDSELEYGGPITGTSRTLPSGVLDEGEAYRWNMRSHNGSVWSDFSDRFYFTVEGDDPPAPPTLVAPGSSSQPGPEISTTTPTMQWSSVSGATGYGFYISRNDGGSWTLIFDSELEYGGPITGTSRALPSGVLDEGEAYRWNMRSHNGSVWGDDFSDRFYFTVAGDEPPEPPILIAPGSSSLPGSEISTTTPTMQWSSSTGATGYGFYVSRNDSGVWTLIFDSEIEFGGPISVTSRLLPDGVLDPGETYRWNMRSYDGTEWGGFSTHLYFFVEDAGVLPPPQLIAPGASSSPGPSISTTTPTMQWADVPDVNGYGLYISRNDLGSWTLVFDSDVEFGGPISGTSLALSAGFLDQGESYRWNMRSHNGTVWGDFSSRFYFSVGSSSAATFLWPVENPNLPVSNGYATPSAPGLHTGLDLTSAVGSTAIKAAAAGVARVFPLNSPLQSGGNHNMGRVVILDHNGGVGPFTLYAHLAEILVDDGEAVDGGEIIGVMGNSGCANQGCGVHLHFEVKNWGVLGSLDDDLGPHWGYTPELPNLHGYIDPWPYLSYNIPISPFQGVVSVLDQQVRTGPDATIFVAEVTQVENGQRFSSFGEHSGWHQVHLAGETGPVTGWIQASPVSDEPTLVTDPLRGLIGVSVRQQPSTSSTRMSYAWDEQAFLKLSTSAAGNGCSVEWSEIDLGDNTGADTGWICGEWLGGNDGSIFRDGFESGDLSAWSVIVP